jgi:hypothetical protein
MKTLDKLIDLIKSNPEATEFQEVIDIIDANYHYTPVSFTNGPADDCIINEAGKNEGSCKIFSFAQKHRLNELQTLNCFGRYYREDVLKHPDNTDHANIRSFIRHGWKNIHFQNSALAEKHR